MEQQQSQLTEVGDSASASADARVIALCEQAKELESKGDYEGAQQLLSPFWSNLREQPTTAGLSENSWAELCLRAGTLTGWLGNLKRIENAQELAKDLIGKSLSSFETLQNNEKVAEAQIELAYCYWREGAFDEARVLLKQALDRVANKPSELKLVAVLRKALVESSATRFSDSLHLLLESAPLFDVSNNETLKGRFHNELAYNFQSLASTENRVDYTDRALVEFTAASFHFEQAGHTRYRAHVENNLGLLFYTLGRYDDAHEHLNQARQLYPGLENAVYAAIVDETRARVFIAQKLFDQAETTARSACEVFEKAGEQAQLSEAMTTQAIALARLKRFTAAREVFDRAAMIAQQAGSIENAGLALITLMEEDEGQLSPAELKNYYQRADELLAQSQHPETLERLRKAARRVLDSQPTAPAAERSRLDLVKKFIAEAQTQHNKAVEFSDEALAAMDRFFFSEEAKTLAAIIDETVAAATENTKVTPDAVEVVALREQAPRGHFADPWSNFSLKGELREPEKRFIELALRAAEGKISIAARLLGFNHNELLTSIIKSRYPELLLVRNPTVPRRRSIIKKK
ncbi:MAG TPA: tetratricopeptide repeat protein [Pyrinomonadaceae bacterium]